MAFLLVSALRTGVQLKQSRSGAALMAPGSSPVLPVDAMRTHDVSQCKHTGKWVASTLLVISLGGFLPVLPAGALEFGNDQFDGSLDTTISHGFAIRVEKRNPRLAADINGNDGNLNFGRSIVSNASKITVDLDISTPTFGVFLRGKGFLDFENQNSSRDRTPLSDEALKAVGKDVELLDAYVTSYFDVGDAAVDVRLGKHVLNWGESTFIPNGINAINHVDLGSLRLPGSELREALLPVNMVSMSVAPNDVLSVEGFYQFDWQKTEIDAVGSYFSTTDYAGPGARKAVITSDQFVALGVTDQGFGFGEQLTRAINADLGADLPQQLVFDPDFASVLRGPDGAPPDSGQFGFAIRYLAEDFNQTEFGFYFMNYHSRLPVVGAQTGTAEGIAAGLAAAGAISTGTETRTAVSAAFPPDQVQAAVTGIATALAIDRYADSGNYILEYPSDIKLYGLSFNTVLGASGWAIQGEFSHRRDAPLQKAERVVFFEGLQPIFAALATQSVPADYQQRRLQGYFRRNVSQVQATATKVFGPVLNSDSLALVAEAAVMHVHNMPDTPIESPAGGVLPPPPARTAAGVFPKGAADADATSWGYRIATRLDYNNAIGSVNLYPYGQFLHDVSGNSPAPFGPFVEGRTGLTLGVGADYLSNWEADLSYTRFAGDGNELSDRDFVSASIKYSF